MVRLDSSHHWNRNDQHGSHRLVLVAGEIINYAPDLVMVYSGHNEFEELQQLRLSGVEVSAAQRALSRSALYRLLRDFRARRAIAALEEARAQRDLAVSLPDASKTWTLELPVSVT